MYIDPLISIFFIQISRTSILTALHCVRNHGANASNLVVIVGINSLTENLRSSNIYFVAHIVYHSLFDSLHLKNGDDIALIKLSRPVDITSRVAFICLPHDNNIGENVNENFILAGW